MEVNDFINISLSFSVNRVGGELVLGEDAAAVAADDVEGPSARIKA